MEKNESDGFIKADQWMPIYLDLLEEDKYVKLSPKGGSMLPFLVGDRDEVILKKIKRPLQRGDVVLYRRDNGIYVLHRIHHIDKENELYFMIGDSQVWIEGPLERRQVLAVAHGFIRKGKKIRIDKFGYHVFYKVWLFIRPFRPYIIGIWWRFHKYLGKEIDGGRQSKY